MEVTRYWKVDSSITPDHPSIQEASQLIQTGEIVAFPTETVYGLGADARNEDAVRAIFKAKGRPSDNPLIVHIASLQQLNQLVQPLPEVAVTLIEHFWPGPLTIVLPMLEGAVPSVVSAGLSTLAVRMPAHPAALSLIEASDAPIAAPSANLSGRPSPTKASHVMEDLQGKISGIIDGGEANLGLESTVIMVQGNSVEILRPGGVTLEQLVEVLPTNVQLLYEQKHVTKEQSPRSPGMKYTHYAPKGDLVIVEGNDLSKVQSWIQKQLIQGHKQEIKTGVLTFQSQTCCYEQADHVIDLGNDLRYAAARLYDALREFDALNIDFIYAETCQEKGIGYAVMNRLRKASGYCTVQL